MRVLSNERELRPPALLAFDPRRSTFDVCRPSTLVVRLCTDPIFESVPVYPLPPIGSITSSTQRNAVVRANRVRSLSSTFLGVAALPSSAHSTNARTRTGILSYALRSDFSSPLSAGTTVAEAKMIIAIARGNVVFACGCVMGHSPLVA